MTLRHESLQERLVEMEEAHVVGAEDRGDESGYVGFSQGFLLGGGEDAEGDGVDEGCVGGVEFAG